MLLNLPKDSNLKNQHRLQTPPKPPHFFLFFFYLRNNWYKILYSFKENHIVIWHLYTLSNDHHKSSYHLLHTKLSQALILISRWKNKYHLYGRIKNKYNLYSSHSNSAVKDLWIKQNINRKNGHKSTFFSSYLWNSK